MDVGLMNELNKNKCIGWFRNAIDSEFGRATEKFLQTFPFPNHEKYGLESFLNKIENDQYISIYEMVEQFKKEKIIITSILGSASDVSLFIDGYLTELVIQLETQLLHKNQIQNSIDFSEKIQSFKKLRDKFPNSAEEFIGIYGENDQPVIMKMDPVFSNARLASIDEIEDLKRKIDELPVDHNVTDIAELIQFYQPHDTYGTEDDEDDEVFKMDLSKLSEQSLKKIDQYIKQLVLH
ncbi:hypothetical protein TRFO_35825 [Tritrichomonas foetus]|uniref:Uncharacterized protein n=1 Tax=Tritrichomonas foetus TaxID=1144522 RepID=A0A1J4JGT7_9EUKA|nr:hypothetical protein TRFO_35825 [Tritrichomonas foetus]|eukprot:OHS97889.1 hypothetical protein TRFO_35825 [Tritrichomonas foetus]